MPLVVYVTRTVLPVGELSLIVALLGGRCVILRDRLHFTWVRHYFKWLESHSMSRVLFHWVGVDDSCLLLHVEGVLLCENASLVHLIHELLLVVGHSALWIGILHEPVGHAHSSST